MLVRVTKEEYFIGRELEQNPELLDILKNVCKMSELEQMCFNGFLEYILKKDQRD